MVRDLLHLALRLPIRTPFFRSRGVGKSGLQLQGREPLKFLNQTNHGRRSAAAVERADDPRSGVRDGVADAQVRRRILSQGEGGDDSCTENGRTSLSQEGTRGVLVSGKPSPSIVMVTRSESTASSITGSAKKPFFGVGIEPDRRLCVARSWSVDQTVPSTYPGIAKYDVKTKAHLPAAWYHPDLDGKLVQGCPQRAPLSISPGTVGRTGLRITMDNRVERRAQQRDDPFRRRAPKPSQAH